MKILFLNNLYYPYKVGGAEKAVQLLAEGLQKFSIEPIVAATAPQTLVDHVNGIKIYYLKLWNFYWPFAKRPPYSLKRPFWHLLDMYNPLMKLEIHRIIKEERPILVHTNNLAGFSVSAWKAVRNEGIPLVHTIHDHYLMCAKSGMFRYNHNCAQQCLQCRALSITKNSLSSLVEHVVSISQFLLNRHNIHGYFPTGGKSVFYNPILPRIKEGENIIKSPIQFGYIGRLEQAKGVEYLLESFGNIDPKKANLILAGTGEFKYVAFLKDRYKAPHISFLGFVPSNQLYSQTNVLIVPSLLHEGLGMVVLEAYSYGIPVIGSKRGGIPELIEDQKTGFLFDPGVPGDLESKIHNFIQEPDLVREMAPACSEKIKEFHVDKVCQDYLGVYRSLLS